MAGQETRKILLLDDDDLRSLLAAALVHYEIGEPIACGSVIDMINRGSLVLQCSLALLDVNLGPGKPSGVDAYLWLLEHGFRGDVAFLTGHAAQHPLVAEAERQGTVRVLQKPIALNVISELSRGTHEGAPA